jgi:hypothetical protein
VATQHLRNGNDAAATTARHDAASYESSPACAAGRPLTDPKQSAAVSQSCRTAR